MYHSLKIWCSNCNLKADPTNSGFPNLWEVTEQSGYKALLQFCDRKTNTHLCWSETPDSELQSAVYQTEEADGCPGLFIFFIIWVALLNFLSVCTLFLPNSTHTKFSGLCLCAEHWDLAGYSTIIGNKTVVPSANRWTINRHDHMTTAFCVLFLCVHLATGQRTSHIFSC